MLSRAIFVVGLLTTMPATATRAVAGDVVTPSADPGELTALRRIGDVLEQRALARERSRITWAHATGDRLRRLDAMRHQVEPIRLAQRARARRLLKWARGGVARALWRARQPDIHERVVTSQLLRSVARHELERLAADVRVQRRIEASIIRATRAARDEAALAVFEQPLAQALGDITHQLEGRAHPELPADPRTAGGDGGPRFYWPVEGRVVGSFGSSLDPSTRLPVERQGVELAANSFAPVIVPRAGEVVWTGSLAGYGEAVVIAHDRGFQTLLGRLWNVRVGLGERVRAGQLVAAVAPKGVPDGLGETVYVELRRGETALDPTVWFVRRP